MIEEKLKDGFILFNEETGQMTFGFKTKEQFESCQKAFIDILKEETDEHKRKIYQVAINKIQNLLDTWGHRTNFQSN